jgi:hypothetical protein
MKSSMFLTVRQFTGARQDWLTVFRMPPPTPPLEA